MVSVLEKKKQTDPDRTIREVPLQNGYRRCKRHGGFFFSVLGQLTSNYSNLFERTIKTGEQESGELIKRNGFSEHWGWFITLDNLSNGDRSKWEYFLSMNVIEFLNYLAFVKDKQKHQEQILRESQRG